MKNKAITTSLFGLILAVTLVGCALFPEQKQQQEPSRPAPVRPQKQSPTKKVPGVSAIGTRELMSRTQRIATAVNKEDWALANKETNSMAGDMTRFKEDRPTTADVDKMAKLDAEYAKLQTNVKGKNKEASLKNIKNLQAIIRKLDS